MDWRRESGIDQRNKSRKVAISLRLMATTALVAIYGSALQPTSAVAQTSLAESGLVRTYSIPAQPLASALNALGRQSGLQVTLAASTSRGVTSRAVSGRYTPQQALAQMLEGTGIPFRITSDRTAVVGQQASNDSAATVPGAIQLDQIDVQGGGNPNSTMTPMAPYAGGQVATGGQLGMLGNRNVMNTPFSQTNYTNKTIRDQQARTLQDVLSNDPSILTGTRSSGTIVEVTIVRGFSETASNGGGSLNGLVGMSPLSSPDMDHIERVEVLRGPSALLNGMGAAGAGNPGGSINLVTKQAHDEPITQLTTRLDSRSQFGAHIDMGRRFGAEKQFGVRFNGSFRKGDTAIAPQSTEFGSVALNMDYRGERVRLSADFAHQSDATSPWNYQLLSLGAVGVVPKAPDVGTSLNAPWSEHRVKSTMAAVRGEVDITDNVTAYAAIGRQQLDYAGKGPLAPTLRDATGRYGFASLTDVRAVNDVLSMQSGIRARATTGPVSHAFNLNLSQAQMETRQSTGGAAAYPYQTNIYNPIFGPAPTLPAAGDPRRLSETKVSSIGVADTLSILNERIQLTAGIRYQQVEAANFNLLTGATTANYDANAWTPAFALVVKPLENVSLYANYIEDLMRGSVVGQTFANAGEILPPFIAKQYEAGVKVDWGRVTTTLAVFEITRANSISVPNPAGLPTMTQDGEQRNRGIELNAYGALTDNVRLLGGITLLDARMTKTQNGLYDGNRALGAPTFRAVIGGEWDMPFVDGLTLTGRVAYTGDQVASTTNENLKLPSWTTVDLGARYSLQSPWNNKPIVVRFNIDNVFDKNYWSTSNGSFLYLGTPRTYRLSASFNF